MSVVSVDVSYNVFNGRGGGEYKEREIILAEDDGTLYIYKKGRWDTIEGPPALKDNNNE